MEDLTNFLLSLILQQRCFLFSFLFSFETINIFFLLRKKEFFGMFILQLGNILNILFFFLSKDLLSLRSLLILISFFLSFTLSNSLWKEVTQALLNSDQASATKFKTEIEENQRKENLEREKLKIQWVPQLFEADPKDPSSFRYKYPR